MTTTQASQASSQPWNLDFSVNRVTKMVCGEKSDLATTISRFNFSVYSHGALGAALIVSLVAAAVFKSAILALVAFGVWKAREAFAYHVRNLVEREGQTRDVYVEEMELQVKQELLALKQTRGSEIWIVDRHGNSSSLGQLTNEMLEKLYLPRCRFYSDVEGTNELDPKELLPAFRIAIEKHGKPIRCPKEKIKFLGFTLLFSPISDETKTRLEKALPPEKT